VQTFLNLRAAYMPKPRRPTIHAATEDSQESQDYFGMFDIDLDDPDLQAVLGDESESPEGKEVARKDKFLAEVVQKTVINGIFKLVMKRVTDVPEGSSRQLAHFDLDKWIDCWVGCAQIVVHNGLRVCSSVFALMNRHSDGLHRPGHFIYLLVISRGKGLQMALGGVELAYGSCSCCWSSTPPLTRWVPCDLFIRFWVSKTPSSRTRIASSMCCSNHWLPSS
jgi:hypothetical protein